MLLVRRSSADDAVASCLEQLSSSSVEDRAAVARRAARDTPDPDHPERRTLDSDGLAQLHRAYSPLYEHDVVIKSWSKRHLDAVELQQAALECEVTVAFVHPHIVQGLHRVDTPDTLRLVMRYYARGDLLTHVNTRRCDEAESRRYFLQLLSALRYAHTHCNVVHLDIKLEYDDNDAAD